MCAKQNVIRAFSISYCTSVTVIWSFFPPATPTLKELSNALDSVVNWHLLGVKLGLEDHELRAIDHDFRGDGNERCKHEMLSHWLRNAKHPTWKAVIDALCLMGNHKVALKIQMKYCTDTGKLTCGGVVLDTFTASITFWL